jgi:hypothetical protein
MNTNGQLLSTTTSFGLMASRLLEVYDKVFRSINITCFWHKDDNFILSTQAIKVFYVSDTKLGKNCRVVQ